MILAKSTLIRICLIFKAKQRERQRQREKKKFKRCCGNYGILLGINPLHIKREREGEREGERARERETERARERETERQRRELWKLWYSVRDPSFTYQGLRIKEDTSRVT